MGGREVVFYQVRVCSGHKKWHLNKRFNDFYDLNAEMKLKHSNLPVLPPKTWMPLTLDKDIDDRRQQLHLYLQEIMNRVDMRTSPVFRKFIEMDHHCPESLMFYPIKVSQISNLQLGGRDFELV